MSRSFLPYKKPLSIRAAVTRLAAVLALVALLGAVYLVGIRPSQLRWGATKEEIERAMPEDGLVSNPAFNATRAITILGRPEQIWPWLVQMGYRRAGFYGYDPIENVGSDGGIRSADAILPALQHPRTGDLLPISAVAALTFGSIETNRFLVWRGREEPPDGVFIWALVPVDASHTRLISRIRWRYQKGSVGRAMGLFTEFGDHVAVRAILFGIRDRVEGRAPELFAVQVAEIVAWLLAMGELGMCMVLVFFRRQWGRVWMLALGAGLLLQFVLYAGAPHLIDAALPWFYLVILVWCWRRLRPSLIVRAAYPAAAKDTAQNAPQSY
jgi:hypothetical protein